MNFRWYLISENEQGSTKPLGSCKFDSRNIDLPNNVDNAEKLEVSKCLSPKTVQPIGDILHMRYSTRNLKSPKWEIAPVLTVLHLSKIPRMEGLKI